MSISLVLDIEGDAKEVSNVSVKFITLKRYKQNERMKYQQTIDQIYSSNHYIFS